MRHTHRVPLLLVHGICSTEKAFCPRPRTGLQSLLSDFFPTFSADLPVVRGADGQYRDFDDHALIDLPESWNRLHQRTGVPPAVLGYSMGGMMALLSQARGLIHAPALMILGSPFTFSGIPFYPPIMEKVMSWAKKVGLKRIPIRLAGRLLFWYFLYSPGGKGKSGLDLFHLMVRKAGADVSLETLSQAVGWVRTGRFCDRTWSHDYLSELHRVTAPTFFVAGTADRIAPPETVAAGYRAVSSKNRHFATIPNASHIDLISGPCLTESFLLAKSWFNSPLL